jgi:alkylation response protein AidB-like acyl-CoA dehydrogenase
MVSQVSQLQSAFAEHAEQLNEGLPSYSAGRSLNLLAENAWLGYGVPQCLGGSDGKLQDAVEAIATVSEQCLTSGFVFWCQRVFIQYLVASNNLWLHQQVLPNMLKAKQSGATGLSNAMKHLAGIEQLRVSAELDKQTVTLNGYLPWASNLQPENFVVAVAAQTKAGQGFVVAIPADAVGLERGEDLQLLGLQASWTSTLKLNQVRLSHDWIISDDAHTFLPKIHPIFLLLQCGLPLGIARQAIQQIRDSLKGAKHVFNDRLSTLQETLSLQEARIEQLCKLHHFDLSQMRRLFQTRITLTHLAVEAVWLELETKGGMAYHKASGTDRRLREVAFLPVLTPSLVQLETELRRHTLAEVGV